MLKKTNKYQTLLAVCLLALSACNSSDSLSADPVNHSKTPIELTVGIVGEDPTTPRALTRTITTDSPYGNAASAFSSATSLYMVMKSEHPDYPTDNTKVPKYTRTIGTVPGSAAESPLNVSFASGYERYWEDSYSRDSKVSVYSACVPGNTATALNIGASTSYNNGTYTWSTDAITPNIAWPLSGTSASQNATFLTAQDLCFSNNVSSLLNPDNRIAFNTTTNKFEARQLIFHHALTKVTFKIKRGNGFGTGTEVFNFTNDNENLVLTGFNTNGTLNISTGEFSSVTTTNPITSLANTKTSADADAAFDYVLTCLMLPGSALTSTATDEVYFTIDDNKYHITKAQLATALNGKTVGSNSTPALTDDKKMRPGVHYVFTMTVSKSQISNLSAAVVGWETVTADEMAPSNARISVSLLNNGTAESGEASFDLLRSPNVYDGETIDDTWASYAWAKDYEKATLSYNSTTGAYVAYNLDGTTPWYWPDNRTFYHFRTLKPKTDNTWKVKLDETDENNKFEYIELTGALYSTTPAESYKDVCWGAPFNDATAITYDPTTNGFDGTSSHQISKAIGPTTATINMNTFHMMSDVTIKLTTTDGTDAVTLSGATVKLTPVYNTGTVKMGNGLITPGGSTTINGTVSQVGSTNTYQWRYGFVPQSLASVVLTITTTDNNQYIINMEDMVAAVNSTIIANPYTETSSGSDKYTINYWYPNFNYTYNFKLKKTGIEAVTATLTEWGAIVADEETVVIQ